MWNIIKLFPTWMIYELGAYVLILVLKEVEMMSYYLYGDGRKNFLTYIIFMQMLLKILFLFIFKDIQINSKYTYIFLYDVVLRDRI